MSQRVLLTEQQAAEWLGLSFHTLRDWRWRKIGPPWLRVSAKCIRYDEEQLRQWLDDRTEHPKAKD